MRAAQYITGKAAQIQKKADSLYYTEQYTQALELYIQGMEMAEREKDYRVYLACTGYIGNIYHAFDDFDSSIYYWLKGYEIAVEHHDENMESNFLSNIVGGYCFLGNVEKAKEYYVLQEKTPRGINPEFKDYFLLYNRARIATVENNYQQAIDIHKEAFDFARNRRMKPIFQLYQLSEIGKLMVRMERYQEAVNYGKRCLKMAEELKSGELQVNACKLLMEGYEHTDEPLLAKEYRERYEHLSDSVYNYKRFSTAISKLKEYEKKMNDMQIDSLHGTISKQLITIIAISTITLLLLVSLYLLNQKNKRLHEAQRLLISKGRELQISEENSRKMLERFLSPYGQAAIHIQEGKNKKTAETQTEEVEAQPTLDKEQADLLFNRIMSIMSDISVISNPDFNLNMLAEKVKSNTKYVSWIINDMHNKNFKTLLNEQRIGEACKRLRDSENYGNLTIQAIYEEVGYKNAVSFIRAFKKVYGMTPSVYQKLALEREEE